METLIKRNRVELKKRILDAARARQESLISDFRQRIKDAMTNTGTVNEDEYESHQQSFNASILSEVNLLNNELEFANHEMEELRKIENFSDTVHLIAEFGAVVRTDKCIFFISVSIEHFKVDGSPIIGISVESPLYQAMKGKSVGQEFFYKDDSYRILEIF